MKDAWRGLYRSGGAAAMVIAVLLIGEIVVYATLPRPGSVAEHFALFREHWLAGLLSLDLLGMICYLLFVPMMLALFMTLRRARPSLAIVATALFFVGIADFFATNTAFPVLSLAGRYAAATTEAERTTLLAAGQAMFTLFDENAFLVSYVIVSASWAMISSAMLLSRVYGRVTALAGIMAGGAGILAVVLEHGAATNGVLSAAIGLYFAAIVFLFLWVILAGRRLFQAGMARD